MDTDNATLDFEEVREEFRIKTAAPMSQKEQFLSALHSVAKNGNN